MDCCFQVRDPNTGKTLGPNQTGEICVKNEITMKQYWNRKQATNEFFDHEGFACTGDLGYYDDAGDMHYVDRMKELIKYKTLQLRHTMRFLKFYTFQVQKQSCGTDRN